MDINVISLYLVIGVPECPAQRLTGGIPMYAQTDNLRSSQPLLMRLLVRFSFEYRRPRLWAGIRFACGAWNLFLGGFLLSYGFWVGLVPLVASPLIFYTSYRLGQCVPSEPAASLAGHGSR
ncbi:MAG: hypothetical protein ACLPQS_10875 [Acidimicrobiales bacterium]